MKAFSEYVRSQGNPRRFQSFQNKGNIAGHARFELAVGIRQLEFYGKDSGLASIHGLNIARCEFCLI
jgi:hypothetical protein